MKREALNQRVQRALVNTTGIIVIALLPGIASHAQSRKTVAPPPTPPVQTAQRVNERNAEEAATGASQPTVNVAATNVRYAYEFKQPQFVISHISIEHDAAGGGQMTFTKRDGSEAFTEPFTLSPAALTRITELWTKLNFLKNSLDLQAPKQFPHLGTMVLRVNDAGETRAAEFNWTKNPDAFALANEYRRISDQALFIFDINIARENQPLEAPALMKRLEILVRRNELSDAMQLVPLLQELSTDERLPLIARNQAGSLAKKIGK